MKKVAVFLLAILLLLIMSFVGLFYWRKHQAQQQYVYRASTAILAIGIDDYVVDNLYDLLKSSGTTTAGTPDDSLKAKDLFFKSGLNIPSRLFLFSIADHPNQLYGRLSIDNYEKALAFFQKHFNDKLTLAEQADGPAVLQFNAHSVALFTKKEFVFVLSQASNPTTDVLQKMLTDKEAFVTVKSLANLHPDLFQAHAAFSDLKQDFALAAFVKKNQLHITGEWALKTPLKTSLQHRQMDSTENVLSFWNNLPLAEIPFFSTFLTSYTGLDQASLADHYADYIDVEVRDQQTQQTDTIVTYSYDDDFNATEEREVRQLHVPQITQVWANEKGISSFLPDRMFYNFYQKQEQGFVINATFTNGHPPLKMVPSAIPLFINVNFQKWPDAWTIGLFKTLKDAACSFQLQAEKSSPEKLIWKGHATWNP